MIEHLLAEIIKQNSSGDQWNWLQEKSSPPKNATATQLNIAFTAVPRKTGKKIIEATLDQERHIKTLLPGFSIHEWTIDRLCRVWLLAQLNADQKDSYIRIIEGLFLAAEMNELVALYSSLPLLSYPETWKLRCTEGIRSNIGSVLEAIMYENPYPAQFLDEPAWNQMILKAFFTDKNVVRITGLDERANERLASILVDYAHERWSAHRLVNPQLWRLVGKFIDEKYIADFEKLLQEGSDREKQAAALALSESNFIPAMKLLEKAGNPYRAIRDKTLTWDSLQTN
jgi:hypothetical protein